ncbi:NACHT, LRR and PYD domains-containing protein 12-like isoform X7 [Ctenopharyngodon idella]|nr:NACHT, LRR and PYD domains-containing protein 12-like isoform X7 [Ctenopharyngodon idella]XP_051717677.1 NACHT, LRR and PYD domains-containing protein 12-like isoform X7 [Ctenopharyngodon idella]XP_051717680.1 NACHT, LRR and PYD domains-containing protein 12-like isoform X7 [Ctenopharyngodon idella]
MDDSQGSRGGDFSPGCSSVQQKSSNPESSCVSVKSNWSMEKPPVFKSGDTRPDLSSVQQKRSNPESSCVSVKSNWSMDEPITFKSEDTRPDLRSNLLSRPVKNKTVFTPVIQPQDFNESMNPGFSHDSKPAEVLNTLRSNLRKKFECLSEGISKQGNPTLLNEIYTELYITESESGEISNEHEVRQIETQSRRAETEDTPIKCSDIFRPLPGQDKPIRTVLTKGVAGIGKTVSVQKFILDWAEGKKNQDVQLIFPLPFRELNLMKDKTLSLSDLLHVFFPETKEMEISSDEYKVLFIFDGLDECRLSLDFQSDVRLCDVTESASVDVLLTNLIVGNLLPSALIWITSRSAAADLVPSECVHRVTEVRGFSDPQKEEYFRKRIRDQSLADRIISHLKSSRSLFIMCHIPVFCWISAAVLEKMLSEAERGEIPKTLTQMYTHFLIIQTNIKHEKDYEKKVKDEDMIVKLGKVAFQQLVKGNLIFYEEDLRECGIDVTEASVYSGLCTQIFREELGLYQGKVFCFVHLSIQEHLAALYVHLSFIKNCSQMFSDLSMFFTFTLSDFHQKAVDEALDSKNGHLDLFLRFLLGLSVESNQSLLQELKTQTGNRSHNNEKTADYIKEKISENPSPDKYINLFHCLNELGDLSLVNEAQPHTYGGLRKVKLSSSQWSALVFVLLTSEKTMKEFNLYRLTGHRNDHDAVNTGDEVLQKLLPVVTETRSARLINCGVTDEGCAALASALRSNPSSHLRDLNLSYNNLGDSGVKIVSAVLENPHCKLEKLWLNDCGVTDEGCAALASALRSNPSHLRDLNLSVNNLGDSGVKIVSAVLENPHCKLEKLRLWKCGVTDEGCAALASALRSNPSSHLRYLNLSENNLGDSGVKIVSAVLENPHCKLEKLRLNDCGVTDEGCAALASALRSNPSSHLRDLNLSENNLGDSGVKIVSAVLENPHCKLEKLWLSKCGVTDEGCAALASALRSNPSSHLRDLDLSENNLGDSGVKTVSAVLENPHCKLEKLWLWKCGVTDEGCAALTSALRSNPSSHLRYLNLSENNLGDSGVKIVSAVLENPHCKLEKLRLNDCGVTDEGCAALASALRSNPSHLRDLNLSENNLGDSGVKIVSAVLENPHCKLEKLWLSKCGVTDEGCAALASALRSNPSSHLRDLDLSENNLGDSGVKTVSAVLENPHCKLEKLWLRYCGVTDEGCAALASALKSNPSSHLRYLGLTENNLTHSEVKLLNDLKDDPHYKLEKLWYQMISESDLLMII